MSVFIHYAINIASYWSGAETNGVTGRSSKEECVEVLDPYNISVELWIDDVSRWSPVKFPHVYTYLIDTPGEFTREKLKAFKSLQAYNYYIR